MKSVLITGASSGIGYEFAKIYAKNGYNLVITARRQENLENIREELESYSVKIETIALDLSKEGAAKKLYENVKEKGIVIDTLINNAGFGLYGNFIETDVDREAEMIDLNIKSLVILTKLFLKDMIAIDKGEILNVASIAAFQPGPLMSVYYASKSFVLSFSEAVRNEIRKTNVNISVLCPGPTATEFERSANLGKSTLFTRIKVMTPEKVALIGYKGLQKKKSIIITGKINSTLIFLNRFVPREVIVNVARKLQELKK